MIDPIGIRNALSRTSKLKGVRVVAELHSAPFSTSFEKAESFGIVPTSEGVKRNCPFQSLTPLRITNSNTATRYGEFFIGGDGEQGYVFIALMEG